MAFYEGFHTSVYTWIIYMYLSLENTKDGHLCTLEEVWGSLTGICWPTTEAKQTHFHVTIHRIPGTYNISRWTLPFTEKVHAIMQAPKAHNVSQIWAFHGLVNYYGKVLPQLSSTCRISAYKLQLLSNYCNSLVNHKLYSWYLTI